MHRVEFNAETHDTDEIEQVAYSVGGKLVVQDAVQPAPEGGTLLTAQQAQALGAGPFDQPAALQRLRDVRALILNALTGVGMDALAAGDTATVAGVVAARQGLKDAPKDAAIQAATNDADFDNAAKALYTRLVIAAPATVRAAFRDVQ